MNDVNCKYEYQPIDRYIVLNDNDQDLFPIKIDQLDLIQRLHRSHGQVEPQDFPDIKLCSGYGLPPKEQFFEREVIPEGLIYLEAKIRNDLKKVRSYSPIKRELATIDTFWETIEQQSEKYQKEIDWLNLMWYYRLFGKFVLIKGKMTYLPPHTWWWLNWWYLDGILPEYRSADRELEIGILHAELDTTTFKNIDPDSRKPIPNEIGEYEMIDLGKSVCMGVNDPKARRVGDTSRAQSKGAERATRSKNFHFGTQGKDEAHAAKVFRENFMKPFEKLPIFFKPLWDSALGVKPKETMLFDGDSAVMGLRTRVTHALSANAENYNGDKLHFYNRDESGNTRGEDVNKGHQIIKICLTLGDKIIGFCMYTTTVQEVSEKSAGENYMKLCLDSNYEIRDENGRTVSGMRNLFIRADKRMEGFIDQWGDPVIDTPTPEQAKFIGKMYGARHFINSTISELKRKKDWEGLAVFQRQFPLKFRDCFSPPARNQFWDTETLRNRIQYLSFSARHELPRRGNFFRVGGIDGRVEWVDDERFGRFYLSKDYKNDETNLRYQHHGIYYSGSPYKTVMSVDTFGLDRTRGRSSWGGGMVWLRFDPTIDDEKSDSSTWKTHRPILTYCEKPDTLEEFFEDMLMAAQYTNSMIYPERNKDNFIVYAKKRKYGGYLLYDRDKDGNQRSEPGFWTDKWIKIKIFNLVKTAVSQVGNRCVHIDWMNELIDIREPEQMTDFDLFTAGGGCLLALQTEFFEMEKYATQKINTSAIIPLQRY